MFWVRVSFGSHVTSHSVSSDERTRLITYRLTADCTELRSVLHLSFLQPLHSVRATWRSITGLLRRRADVVAYQLMFPLTVPRLLPPSLRLCIPASVFRRRALAIRLEYTAVAYVHQMSFALGQHLVSASFTIHACLSQSMFRSSAK